MRGKKALLAGAIFITSILAYNCGGGGGGTVTGAIDGGATAGETSGTTTLNVYVTDAPPPNLTAFEVSLYSIDLCLDASCTNTVNVFSNPNGVSIDLTNLEGTLLYLDTSNIPAGTYPAVRVEIGQQATAVLDGSPYVYLIDCQTNANGNCEYRVAVNFDSTQNSKLVIDLNLSQATFDIANRIVSNLVVQPVDPQQIQLRQYKYEVYGVFQGITPDGQFTFTWGDQTYTAQIGPNTVCELKVNGQEVYYVGEMCISALSQLQQGSCLELKLYGDPAQTTLLQDVIKFETTYSGKCGISSQSISDSSYENYERERYLDLTQIDFVNGQVTLPDGQTCSISENVYCEIDDVYEEDRYLMGQSCLNSLGELLGATTMTNARIEVKFRLNSDGSCEVYKIEVDDWDRNYNENGNMNDNYSNGNYNENGNYNDNYEYGNGNYNENYNGNYNENDNLAG